MAIGEWVTDPYLNPSKIPLLRKQFIAAQPFPHLVLPQFLPPKKTRALVTAVSKEKFYAKESDLFQLKQTADLASTKNKQLADFRDLLYSQQFLWYMHELTGMWLAPRPVDLQGSLYEDTDYLLCHDDRVSGRTIAFLFYLSTMKQGQGGTLDLYSSRNGKPFKVSKQIIPSAGTLAFFEVSKKSFHAVSEVTSPAPRVAIGGWFHR